MVPHTVVDSVLSELKPLLEEGDIVIEAGNSHYKESIRRYEELKEDGIRYMDAGTSGGMEGARQWSLLYDWRRSRSLGNC